MLASASTVLAEATAGNSTLGVKLALLKGFMEGFSRDHGDAVADAHNLQQQLAATAKLPVRCSCLH